MTTTVEYIRQDILVLVKRLLANGDIFMFGEDGNGQHGRCDQALRSKVVMYDISLSADNDEEPSDIHCVLKLYIQGYDSAITGHAITDKNLEICLNVMFQREHLDIDSWDWGAFSMQGKDYIILNLDVSKFLDWA